MSIFEYGGPSYGLKDLKIARWNGDGTWGTLVDVPSAMMYVVGVETSQAELRGDDVVTATHAKPVAVTLQFQFGSIDLRVLEILTGITPATYGTSPSRRKHMWVTNSNFPYFGVIGMAEAVEGSGATEVFVPKAKIIGGFSLEMQDQAFAMPGVQGRGVEDSLYTSNGLPVILQIIKRETKGTLAIPPAN